jgi:hypothetical protein
MKNSLCLGVLAVTCLGLGVANAQPPATLPPADTGPSAPMPSVPFAAPDAPAAQPAGQASSRGVLNDYLSYLRPTGSTGVGSNGPIGNEAYIRSGVTANLGNNNIFGHIYQAGIEVQGGVRSIFYRPEPTVGWTVDVGLSSVWYHHRKNEIATLHNFPRTTSVLGQNVTTIIPNFPVTPTELNQTSFRVALGQEYYLMGDADPADGFMKWRAGWDAGGDLGTQKLNFLEIRHRTSTIGGGLAAVHTDIEMPYGMCILQAGLRAEYRYTWSNILGAQNDTNMSTLGAMVTAGVRY